jgi:hypothetical protein
MALDVELIRPDDLLNLRVSCVNMQLDTADPYSPTLAMADPEQPAYLVVEFPPQTIAEQAFFEASPVDVSNKVDPADKPRIQRDAALPPSAPTPPGSLAARLGGPSRLVFRVPADARIPFTAAALLDWSTLELVVAPIADVPEGTDPPLAALTIRPPSELETALELPYRLLLSPQHNVAWDHQAGLVVRNGRAELWHTRLAGRAEDGTVLQTDNQHTLPLRAIWSPDFQPDHPPSPGDFGTLGALGAMSPFDRHSIVLLTSAFRGYAIDAFTAYVPAPVQASQLMLSPLGGWLRSIGAWNPPFRAELRRRRFLLEADLPLRVLHIGDDGAAIEVEPDPADMAAHEEAAQPVAAKLSAAPLAFEPLDQFVFLNPIYNLFEQLDLSQWVHIASQGRDHYVRIVYEGKLKDLGHRAALIKVTERRFEPDPQGGAPVAYLRQFMYIVVREPLKDYTREGLADGGRGMPFQRVRLTTLVTPKIDYPYAKPSAITDRSFWVRVSNDYFRFHAVAEDFAGNQIDFTTPLIFVPNSEQNFAAIDADYRLAVSEDHRQRRRALIPGQKVKFAESEIDNQNTSFFTQALIFENEGQTASTFFKPRMLKAEVRIPAVEQLVGDGTLSSIRLLPQYRANGFTDAANATGVFAEIVKETGVAYTEAGLAPATTALKFAANQAGGFATPSLDITNLSRKLGPLGGSVGDALADKFDPSAVFKKGLAQIFGAFDLADLILGGGSAGQNAPKMQVRRDGTAVIAELDWKPAVQAIDLKVITFTPHNDTVFDVHALIKKDLAVPANDDFTLDGKLNHFEIFFLKVVQINFDTFSFHSQTGKKTDVNVKLNDATPVQFEGDLKFVEGLRKIIPPGVFGDGVSIDLIDQPLGVRAGLEIGLPPAAVGVFALQNISFAAGLTIPFLEGKPVFDFAFARRDNPFMLTVSLFGGGGFFRIELDTAGLRVLEAAFEFGAAASIDIGVASGEVHIMAGIYFKMEKRPIPDLGEKLVSVLSGYLRCGGRLSVLGIVTISVEFLLSFTYDSGKDKATGRATLTVTIEIAFFSKSVELTVERSFGGKGGDPTFAQLVDTPEVWDEYAAAFA